MQKLMRHVRLGIILIVTIVTTNSAIFGQQTQAQEQDPEKFKKAQERAIEDSFTRLRNMQAESSPMNYRRLVEPKLTDKQKVLITPLKEDEDKFAPLLADKKTKLIKLLVNQDCNSNYVIDVSNPKCRSVLPYKGEGSYYSFRKGYYSAEDWSDIQYEDGNFLVGFNQQLLGVISSVKNSSIESINQETAEVKFLSDIKAPKNIGDIERWKMQLKNKAVKSSEAIFSDRAKVKLNESYVLRSIAYRWKHQANNDERADVIIALQVVRIDADGALTILWKRLSKTDAPYLSK